MADEDNKKTPETPEETSQEDTKSEETKEEPKEDKQDTKDKRIADHNAKQAEKLVETNKELKQDKDKSEEKYQNLLDSLKPEEEVPQQVQQQYQQPINQAPPAKSFENLDQQDVNNVFKGMVDDQGYLDGPKLLNVLSTMNKRAENAEARASKVEKSQEDFEQTTKSRELHAKYPQLDPENKDFNKDFWELVRNEVIGQMMTGKEDPIKAADKWYNKLYKSEMNKDDTKKKEESEDTKRQINAVRPRSPMATGYYEKEEAENLRKKVIAGKRGALAETLKRHEAKLAQ